MTEFEILRLIRRICGISKQRNEQAAQPDSVTADNYMRIVAEVMRRDDIELNGADMRNTRTRVLELLAYRRRPQQRRESAKNTYQQKKPERLWQQLTDIPGNVKLRWLTCCIAKS